MKPATKAQKAIGPAIAEKALFDPQDECHLQALNKKVEEMTTLHKEVVGLHEKAVALGGLAVPRAVRIGDLLTEVKSSLPHGQWLSFIKDMAPFSDQTARNYMRVFQCREDPRIQNVLNLNQAYRVLSAYDPSEPRSISARHNSESHTRKQLFKTAKLAWLRLNNEQQLKFLQSLEAMNVFNIYKFYPKPPAPRQS